jgi:hypothetical protein
MDRKLFTLTEGTPIGTDKIAYGNAGDTKNITVDNFKIIMGGTLITTILEIGEWNMNTTAEDKAVFHTLDITKIRTINVIIRNNANTQYAPLNQFSYFGANTGISEGGVYFIFDDPAPKYISLIRRTGGMFDNAAFGAAVGYNRGWITVQSIP